MITHTLLLMTAATLMVGCQSETARPAPTSPPTNADPAAEKATKINLAAEPRIRAVKRLDQLDAQIESWAHMLGGGADAQAQRRAQAAELRAKAKRMREQLGTLGDMGGTDGRNLPREVEEGLREAEEAMKRLGESVKE